VPVRGGEDGDAPAPLDPAGEHSPVSSEHEQKEQKVNEQKGVGVIFLSKTVCNMLSSDEK
jgi:hypothetical protein